MRERLTRAAGLQFCNWARVAHLQGAARGQTSTPRKLSGGACVLFCFQPDESAIFALHIVL